MTKFTCVCRCGETYTIESSDNLSPTERRQVQKLIIETEQINPHSWVARGLRQAIGWPKTLDGGVTAHKTDP